MNRKSINDDVALMFVLAMSFISVIVVINQTSRDPNHTAELLGGFSGSLILPLIIALFFGRRWRISKRKFWICLSISTVVFALPKLTQHFAQGLRGEGKAVFIESARKSCEAVSKTQYGSDPDTVSTIGRFCECRANELAKRLSMDDIKSLNAMKSAEDARAKFAELANQVDNLCLERLDKN